MLPCAHSCATQNHDASTVLHFQVCTAAAPLPEGMQRLMGTDTLSRTCKHTHVVLARQQQPQLQRCHLHQTQSRCLLHARPDGHHRPPQLQGKAGLQLFASDGLPCTCMSAALHYLNSRGYSRHTQRLSQLCGCIHSARQFLGHCPEQGSVCDVLWQVVNTAWKHRSQYSKTLLAGRPSVTVCLHTKTFCSGST